MFLVFSLDSLRLVLPIGCTLAALAFLGTLLKTAPARLRLPVEPVARTDSYIALSLAAAFYLIALWRLDEPVKAVFDECYHARTGMQYLIGQNPTEWTHPPLAKLAMAMGLRAWGGAFNPTEGIYTPEGPFDMRAAIGWRFPSLVAGTLTLLVLFALARSITRNRRAATLATAMLALDGVFFVQSRIAMTNIFTVLFILTAALGAWKYRQGSGRSWLLAVGLGLGCAIATRWTSLYAWGLLALFLLAADLPRVWRSPRTLALAATGVALLAGVVGAVARFYQPGVPEEWTRGHAVLTQLGGLCATAAAIYLAAFAGLRRGDDTERRTALPGWYLLAFFAIPAAIYLLCYLPYMRQGHDLVKVFSEQKAMWDYHAGMKETHGYSSPWWSWPLMLRPAWYYFHSTPDVSRVTGIWCIGNAFLWWASMPALFVAAALALRDRRNDLGLPALLGIGLWLAWGVQPRPLVFLHYLFEAIPFACIALAYLGLLLWRGTDPAGRESEGAWIRRAVVGAYGIVLIGWWLFYYPLLSAYTIGGDYYERHLWLGRRWV